MRSIVLAATLFVAVGISAPPAQADSLETVVYEGFDYPSGSLDGANGGTGWSGAWAYPQGGDSPLGVNATGLTYSGLTSEGGATQFRGVRPINGSGRDLARIDSGVVFIRFLTKLSGGFSNGAPTFRLFDTTTGLNTLLIGSNNTGNNASLISGDLTPRVADSGVNINDDATHLLIARIDYSEATVDLWVDPDLSTFDYTSPPSSDSSLTSFAPEFDRIYLFNRFSGAFDEVTILRLVSSTSTTSIPTYERETLELEAVEGVSCRSSESVGQRGQWVTLPASDECTVTDRPNGSVLGWATIEDFPIDIAQRQVDNGWGAYELFDDDGRMTGVFIPAGGATFLSNSSSLYPIITN